MKSSDVVKAYFRAKRGELTALADLAVCEHSVLKGGHREQIYRAYLADLLPKRYAVGRGMVYGMFHRSREADIVIWDAQSYPSLPLLDHSFFFAESVKAVLECKSNWSADEFDDVLKKCKAVRDIVPHKEPSLDDDIAMLQLEVAALKDGVRHEGMMISNAHIATAAMFLRGGKTVTFDELLKICTDGIDDTWPDVLLLLEPGILITKNFPVEGEGRKGRLSYFEHAEDALLSFSIALLSLVEDRIVHNESRFFLEQYTNGLIGENPRLTAEFNLTRMLPSRVPLRG